MSTGIDIQVLMEYLKRKSEHVLSSVTLRK